MTSDVKIKGALNGLLSGFLTCRRMAEVTPYLSGCKRILDVGCGIFNWRTEISPVAEFVGIDCEEQLIRFNQNNYPHKFFHVNLEESNLDFDDGKFDLIILAAVLEHLKDPAAELVKLVSKLSNNGLIVLTTPHPLGKTILSAGALFRLLARDKHQHQNLLSRTQIEEIARISCCDVIKYRRFLFGLNQLAVLRRA